MPDFPDFDTLFRIAADELLARNPRLSFDAVKREGSDSNALIAAGAATADEVVAQLARVAAGLYLDSAEGDLLDRLVFDRYGMIRKPAAPAVGSVQFTTTNPAAAGFSIPNQTILSTSDGRQFITVAAALFVAGTTGPVSVPVRSVLAGLDQQVGPNTIQSILGQIPGASPDLAVTNTLATAGAADAEDDADLRDRARRFFTTARRGTLTALEEAALGVPGIQRATAIEAIDGAGRPARFVQLIVADAFVEALALTATVPPTFPVQSQQLAASVSGALDDVRAAGVQVEVIVAQVVMVTVALQLRFYAGADPSTATLAARAAIVGYINSLAGGERLSIANLIAALANVRGLAFSGDEVVSPVGDIIPQPLQVLRTTLELVVAQATVLGSRSQQTTFQSAVSNPPSVDAPQITAIKQIAQAAANTATGGTQAPGVVSSAVIDITPLVRSVVNQILQTGVRAVIPNVNPNIPPIGVP